MDETQRIPAPAGLLLLGELDDNDTTDGAPSGEGREGTTSQSVEPKSRRGGGGGRATGRPAQRKRSRGKNTAAPSGEGRDSQQGTTEEASEEAQDDASYRRRRLSGKQSVKTKAELAALLAKQPRTLRADNPPWGMGDGSSTEDEEEKGEADLDGEREVHVSGQPLLGVESESGESPAVALSKEATSGPEPRDTLRKNPRTTTRSPQPRRTKKTSAPLSPQPDGAHEATDRSSVSPQTLTTSTTHDSRMQSSLMVAVAEKKYTSVRKPHGKRLGALAVPTWHSTGTSGNPAGSGWADVLRQHQKQATGDAVPEVDGKEKLLPSHPSKVSLQAERSTHTSAPSRTMTEAFVETAPGFHVTNGGTAAPPQMLTPTESPVPIPTGIIPGKTASQQTPGIDATLVAENLTLLSPSMGATVDTTSHPRDGKASISHAGVRADEGYVLGVSPASDSSPRSAEPGQTLGILDLSLAENDDDEEETTLNTMSTTSRSNPKVLEQAPLLPTPAPVPNSSQGIRPVPSPAAPLAETLDDGFVKGEGMGVLSSVAAADPVARARSSVLGEKTAPTEDLVAKAAPQQLQTTDSSSQETPLFAAAAPAPSTSHTTNEHATTAHTHSPSSVEPSRKCQRQQATGRSSRAAECDVLDDDIISVGETPEPSQGDVAAGVRKRTAATKVPSKKSGTQRAKNDKKTKSCQELNKALLLLESGIRIQGRWGGLWCDAVTMDRPKNGYVEIQWLEDGSTMHLKLRDVRLPKRKEVPSSARAEVTGQEESAATVPKAGRLKEEIRLPTSNRDADTRVALAMEREPARSENGNTEGDGDGSELMVMPRKRPHTELREKPVSLPSGLPSIAAAVQEGESDKAANLVDPAKRAENAEAKSAYQGEAAEQPDSQQPLITAVSPEKQRLFVATQNMFEQSGHEDVHDLSEELKGSPSVKRDREEEHPRGQDAAQHARRRWPVSSAARSRGGVSPPPPGCTAGEQQWREDDDNEETGIAHTSYPAVPPVAIGEDYYFYMPHRAFGHQVAANVSSHAPVAPAVLLGRVVAVDVGGFASVEHTENTPLYAAQEHDGRPAAAAARVQPRVVLQVYEMRQITMRQNPLTGELEQQTTVMLGPRQAVVPITSLLFDTPVFVLAPAAMRHVYLLEEERVEGEESVAEDLRPAPLGESERRPGLRSGGGGLETQRLHFDDQDEEGALTSSTESYFSQDPLDGSVSVGDPQRRTEAPSDRTREQRTAPLVRQLYGNTAPLPLRRPLCEFPRGRHAARPHGALPEGEAGHDPAHAKRSEYEETDMDDGYDAAPFSGSSRGVLEEVTIGNGQVVREGATVAFHNPYILRSSLPREGRSPFSSVRPTEQDAMSAVGTGTGTPQNGDSSEESTNSHILYGKVDMLRQVNHSAVLVVHTMSHNSIFGGSKMYVITPDMVLDVA